MAQGLKRLQFQAYHHNQAKRAVGPVQTERQWPPRPSWAVRAVVWASPQLCSGSIFAVPVATSNQLHSCLPDDVPEHQTTPHVYECCVPGYAVHPIDLPILTHPLAGPTSLLLSHPEPKTTATCVVLVLLPHLYSQSQYTFSMTICMSLTRGCRNKVSSPTAYTILSPSLYHPPYATAIGWTHPTADTWVQTQIQPDSKCQHILACSKTMRSQSHPGLNFGYGKPLVVASILNL